ncbi:hypothetical protein DICPUDRAFT_82670 [Dictyostelium purpureum]|uniref:Cyclin N-terminal domain-containing protein n=1 Tax=Dictyostelium purpureum TaxID=5786 RepID=F0ZX78_DICPU|nr:uncharacterized protein DICPUDRAFT_82670 [Dictyostelium purpureum]EGC31456.1 hypothetical protein DICPUDRAFT_82670 [Dictyostelium purpureum]|eukprot:XP_003292025.1 hypothetical protein DICPUDRAFT_82670 [Dictyostelium purpureum]
MNNNNNNNINSNINSNVNRYIPILNLDQIEKEIKNNFKINFNNNTDINKEEWDDFNLKFKRVVFFVKRVCELLSLSSLAYFHTIILFRRFISKVPLKDYNFYLVAMSCILICVKVNPSSIIAMKVRDILNISYYILTNEKLLINDDYYNFKDNVIDMEKKVLITLEFNISISVDNSIGVKLPHSYLFHFLLFLDFEKDHLVSQISLNFLNDSLLILFIQSPYFQPEEIALYSIFLSLEFTKNEGLKIDRAQLYSLLGLTNSNNNNNGYNNNDIDNKYNIFKNYLNNLYLEIKFSPPTITTNNENNNLTNDINNSLNIIHNTGSELIQNFFKK